jgi:uncharacterized protein involved in exopolysaccharide biosynthesis
VKDARDVVVGDLDLHIPNLPENGSPEAGEDRSLRTSPVRFLELLWAERRFVLLCGLASLVVFTIIAFLLPKRYTATTQLMPPGYGVNSQLAMALPALNGEGGGGNAGGVMGLASQLLGMNTSGELVIGVLGSRKVEDGVVDKLGLMAVYSDKYRVDARKHLANNTGISIGSRTGIITISATDKNPVRAAAIANAYVNELNQVLASVNASSAHRERVFLEERLREVKQQSEADAKEFALFASQNAAVDIPDQAKAMVTAGAQLQSQLIVAQSELRGLRQIYAPENPRVAAAKARVDELQRQFDKFGGKNVDPERDASLAQSEVYPSVRQLPLLGVRYLDLFRRTKINEAVFELLTKEFEIAKIQEAKESPTAEVLDDATVPEKKSSPHRLLIMLAGALAGVGLAGAYLIGRVLWEEINDRDPMKLFAQNVFLTAGTWVERTPLLRSSKRGLQRISVWLPRPLNGNAKFLEIQDNTNSLHTGSSDSPARYQVENRARERSA